MSMLEHNEVEAQATLQSFVDGLSFKCDLKLFERKPLRAGQYTAIFVIVVKDGNFTAEFIQAVFNLCTQSDELFSFDGTSRDLKDMSFDAMFIETKVTP